MANSKPSQLFGLRLSIQNPSLGRAYRFIRAMDAADPAAWPAFSFQKFRDCPLNMILSCFGLFSSYSPANPFVTGKRGKILPSFQYGLIGQ